EGGIRLQRSEALLEAVTRRQLLEDRLPRRMDTLVDPPLQHFRDRIDIVAVAMPLEAEHLPVAHVGHAADRTFALGDSVVEQLLVPKPDEPADLLGPQMGQEDRLGDESSELPVDIPRDLTPLRLALLREGALKILRH